MQTQPSCTLHVTGHATADLWCMYEHHLIPADASPPVLIFIGACKLADVYSFTEARRNTEWIKYVTADTPVAVRIVSTGTRDECMRAVASTTRAMATPPHCNVYGHTTHGMARPVMCSNGVTYPTQLAAARDTGVNQGALSTHLTKGAPKHLKGLTFWFVAPSGSSVTP